MDGAVYILYHCNDTARCQKFINEPNFLIESIEDGIWLGSGMYFWDNISNTRYWEKQKRKKVSDLSIIAAKVSGDHMLDLTDSEICDKINTIFLRVYRNKMHKDGSKEELGKKLNFLYDNLQMFRENYDLMKIYGKYYCTLPSFLFRYDTNTKKAEPTLAVKCIYNVKNPKCILQRKFAEEESL